MSVQYPINKASLKYAIEELEKYNIEDASKYKIELCKNILLRMNNSPDMWQSLCPFNYNKKDTVSSFISDLHHPIVDNQFNDRLLFISLFFLREAVVVEKILGMASIREKVKGGFSSKEEIWNCFIKNYKNLSEIITDSHQSLYSYPNNLASYIIFDLPIDILNHHLGNKEIKAFIEYENIVKDADIKIEEIKREREKVDELEKSLRKFKTAFNFVGLSQGFEGILNKKDKSKRWTFWCLVGLAIVLLAPVAYEAYYLIKNNVDTKWQNLLPVAGLELILIYLFRVVLNHYLSLQTQIMQLELRQSICQFIEEYVKFAEKIKETDRGALEKFENLIFSGIVLNPNKIPGTFDGIDSIAPIIDAIKGK